MYLQDFAPLFKSRRPPFRRLPHPLHQLRISLWKAQHKQQHIHGVSSRAATAKSTPPIGSGRWRNFATLQIRFHLWPQETALETRKKPRRNPLSYPSDPIFVPPWKSKPSSREPGYPTRSKVRAASLAGPWHSWRITQCWVPQNPLPVNHRHTVDGSEILHHLTCMKPCKSWDMYDIYHINWWTPDFWTINPIFGGDHPKNPTETSPALGNPTHSTVCVPSNHLQPFHLFHPSVLCGWWLLWWPLWHIHHLYWIQLKPQQPA